MALTSLDRSSMRRTVIGTLRPVMCGVAVKQRAGELDFLTDQRRITLPVAGISDHQLHFLNVGLRLAGQLVAR
jgi:hypothetical protein